MDDFKFNAHAFIKPQTPQEVSALLSEAVSELKQVNAHLRDLLKPAA